MLKSMNGWVARKWTTKLPRSDQHFFLTLIYAWVLVHPAAFCLDMKYCNPKSLQKFNPKSFRIVRLSLYQADIALDPTFKALSWGFLYWLYDDRSSVRYMYKTFFVLIRNINNFLSQEKTWGSKNSFMLP